MEQEFSLSQQKYFNNPTHNKPTINYHLGLSVCACNSLKTLLKRVLVFFKIKAAHIIFNHGHVILFHHHNFHGYRRNLYHNYEYNIGF